MTAIGHNIYFPVVILFLASFHQGADFGEHAQAVLLDVSIRLEMAEVLVLNVDWVVLKESEEFRSCYTRRKRSV